MYHLKRLLTGLLILVSAVFCASLIILALFGYLCLLVYYPFWGIGASVLAGAYMIAGGLYE